MPRTVFLATISSVYQDWIPYAVGCLISHCLKNPRIKSNYVFLEPEYKHKWDTPEFNNKLEKTDILGLTNYVWNQNANDTIAKRFKKINPEGIVVYGGPNVPEDDLGDYARDFVDHYIAGPGEVQFEKLLDPQSDNEYKIPVPYLDGVFDSILEKEKNLAVQFETNRGCPYRCTFCDWGGVARSKISKLEDSLVNETIEYILKFKSVKRLEILDANFGIFERDKHFVQHIVDHKQRDDMLLTFAGFAKNGSKWLAEIMNLTMENFNDRMRNIKISLQTLTPGVLETIDRKNIQTEKLLSIMDELENVEVNSELIIGLPGETNQSWTDTLFKHPELGFDVGRGYPLYVLPNTPMAKQDYKDKYSIKTKKIILPNNETFEMIYECHSYDLEEIVNIYMSWWYFNTFYNFGIDKTVNPATMKVFFATVDDMPLMKSCVDNARECLYDIFKPEPVLHLQGNSYEYIHKNLGRGRELIQMKRNIEQAREELGLQFNILNEERELQSPFARIKQ